MVSETPYCLLEVPDVSQYPVASVLGVLICTRMNFRPAVRIPASEGMCVVELVDYMSSECINIPGPPTRFGPPASELDEVLKPHNVTKHCQRPRTRTDLW